MTGKRALVTGAGKRLGRAMALYLGTPGLRRGGALRVSADGAEDTAREIRAHGRSAVTLQADCWTRRSPRRCSTPRPTALGGPITCLVNNASIFEHDTIGSATRESWDRHIGINLRAPFVLTQAMAAQGLEPATDATGEPPAPGLIVNMIDQRVLQTDAGIHDLHAGQDRALGVDPDQRAGAGAGHPRQRDRPGSDPARGEPDARRHFARQRARPFLGGVRTPRTSPPRWGTSWTRPRSPGS